MCNIACDAANDGNRAFAEMGIESFEEIRFRSPGLVRSDDGARDDEASAGRQGKDTQWQMAELCAMTGLAAHQVRYWFKEALPEQLQVGLRTERGYQQHAAELLMLLRHLHVTEGLKSAGIRRRVGAMSDRERAVCARHRYLLGVRRELMQLLAELRA